MIKRELVKLNDMDVLEQEFCNSEILTAQLKSNGKIYVGLKCIVTGIGLSEGQWQSLTRKIKSDLVIQKGIANLQLPTKGGNQVTMCLEIDYLPLFLAKISITPAMKNEHPEITEKLVEYQLKAKDVLAEAFLGKRKEWDLHREVGKIDRKRMTSSISQNIYNAQSKTYSDYTNMVYDVLFGMTAKEIRESRNINKKSQLTRDYLTKDELKLVDEAETIVTALVSLGFKKDYILDQLRRKFQKRIA